MLEEDLRNVEEQPSTPNPKPRSLTLTLTPMDGHIQEKHKSLQAHCEDLEAKIEADAVLMSQACTTLAPSNQYKYQQQPLTAAFPAALFLLCVCSSCD